MKIHLSERVSDPRLLCAVTSQQVALTIVSIDRRQDAATVAVRRRDTITAGGRRETVDSNQTLQLARTPGGWVVVTIR